jgi:DNA repair exonuclease SbcCD ATPase subunit
LANSVGYDDVQEFCGVISERVNDLIKQKEASESTAKILTSQLETLVAERDTALADRQARSRERERLTGELYALKARIQDRKNQTDIANQIIKLESDILAATDRIRVNTEKLEHLRTQIEDLRNQLSNKQAQEFEVRRLKTEIQGIFSSAQKQVEVWTAQIKTKEQQIGSLNNQEQDLEDRMDTARERYAQAAEKLLSIEEHIDKLKDETAPLEYWERQFGTDLQIQILELVCQAIQDQANEYLLKLECGLRFEFDIRVARGKEKLFILTCDSLGKVMAPRGRSGGEQSRLKVAIDLAMKSLSEERINLTWLDETLDGLDGSGISTVLDSVRDFAAGGRNRRRNP